jgi:glucose dehydrogenase
MQLFKNLRKFENFHIVLWLVKDTCWCLDYKIAGMVMIVPTFLAAFVIVWLGRANRADLFHNAAVCSWITANGIWMIGEFFYNDTLRPYAIVFFILGLSLIAFYYLFLHKKEEEPTETDSLL